MSESIIISGKVVAIGEIQTFDSGFKKQTLVVDNTNNAQYPSPVPIDFQKDKIELLQPIHIGDIVDAMVFISGNEHKGKYYANIKGFGINVVQVADSHYEPTPEESAAEDQARDDAVQEDGDSDNLPF